MSDFIKNLKSLFVEDGKSQESSKATESPTGTDEDPPTDKEATSTPPATEPVFPVSNDMAGQVSQKFTKILLQAIEKYNQEGFDYLEYKNSVKSLSKLDMDEATRYKSAFAMGQTMGIDADKLIKSAKHYQEVLSTEKSKFDSAAGQQMAERVESKKRDLKSWEQQITQKEKKIAELKAEVATLRSNISKINEALDIEEAKVKKTQADFVASYNNLVNQIAADIKKMTDYLK